MSLTGRGTCRAAPVTSQLLLLAPTPWQQSLKGTVAPMGAVPSTPSPAGPHRLLSATLGSSQAPALVPSVWDWHTAGLCHASWGRDPQAPQVAVQSSNARGMVPPGRVMSTPWLAVGGGGPQPWLARGKVGVGAGPGSGNAAHRHFVWLGWAEVRALDLNAKVCCSGADKGPIVCK